MKPFDLNLRHVRAIHAIYARGSMSAAAEAVSLSQPALTQGIAKLERQLGVRLFERRADGMTPTEAGKIFAERAAAAIAHLAAASPRRGTRGFARPELLMTSTQLGAFLALADAGSFAGASQATGLSQPALHRAVRDLEQLGAQPLVDRRGRGVALTDVARRLARGVRLAAAELAAAIAETAPDGGEGGRIVIGAMPLCRAQLLPAALAKFVGSGTSATIDVLEGSWRELVEPLRDGAVDFMIGALRSEEVPDLVQTPLLADRLAVIGRTGHPLAGRNPDLDALAQYPWIVSHAGTPLRTHWEAIFHDRPLPAAPIECGSVMTIRGVLRDSDFLTLLSPDQVGIEIETGMLTRIGGELPGTVRTIGVTTRAGWRPTLAQNRFLDLLNEQGLQLSE
ncbi:LysR family transcriptional regulator [Sphingomonas soli]|uniref:LysR family transcriptional regulator n=1 Tax=Sphingomonas soli TaxID=266127 RepID=UPI000834644B|nr:LysR family transcriptional regulator [Sphingomonas soli]